MPRPELPVDPDAGELQRFAFELRRLREKAGNPSYRDLARLVHYSVSTLSEAARGRKLPSLAVTLAYVRACGGEEAEWEARWRELAKEIDQDALAGLAAEELNAPYVGLTAYGPGDADRFFGREVLVNQVLELLAVRALVVVVGASGSGKSSVLRAGVLPRLEHGVLLTPGPHPMDEVEFLLDGSRPLDAELVLVVDQFEELFTRCHDPAERQRFVTALTSAAATTDGRVKVVIGLRADFYAHCARYPELAEALQDGQILAAPMSVEQLRQAITRPAVNAGCAVETALVTRLVSEASGQPGVLPLLSHALVETWRRRRGNTLTLAGYEASGGIEGAIGQTAESVYDSFTDSQQDLARQVFLRLIELGEGTEDTKRRVARTELDTGEPELTVVLERLAQARLLTLNQDHADLAHEAIIRCWPRLREWLTEDRDGLRTARRLGEAAEEWVRLDRDPGALYRGAQLALATDWARRGPDRVLNRGEQDFLAASTAAEDKEELVQRHRDRRLRQLVALLTTLLLLTGTATGFAVWAEQRTSAQRTSALVQKAVVQAEALRATNPALSWQLRLAAYRADPARESADSLLSTSAEPFTTIIGPHSRATSATLFHPTEPLLVIGGADDDRVVRLWDVRDRHRPKLVSTMEGHHAGLHNAAWSKDGRMLATAALDRTARLWDLSDPRRPRALGLLAGHSGNVEDVDFSPDGKQLVTVAVDKTMRIWDIANPDRPQLLSVTEAHTDLIHAVGYSPVRPLLATAGWDGLVKLWDISDPRRPREIPFPGRHADGVQDTVFSADGGVLATAGTDRLIKLWDVRDPARPVELSTMAGHTQAVHALTFAPGGTALASTSGDASTRLWDITDPRKPRELAVVRGHTDAVWRASFSPDGITLATSSDDRTVKLADLRRQGLPQHGDAISSMAYSPNGRLVVTSGSDRIPAIWQITDDNLVEPVARLPEHGSPVDSVAISNDGRHLFTASLDRTVRVWDLADPARPKLLSSLVGHENAVDTVAVHPDGTLVATSSWDNRIGLWDLKDPAKPGKPIMLVEHNGDVLDVNFSPDGKLLASAGLDGTVRLWDLTDRTAPREVASLRDHPGGATGAVFSPNSKNLVTFGNDHRLQIWDITEPARASVLAEIGDSGSTVQSVAFSPDGRTLAVAGNEGLIRLHNVADPAKPAEFATLSGHSNTVYQAQFSPDGSKVASVSADRTLRIWDIDTERAAARICAMAYPRITEQQWEKYLPGLDFEPPCPG
ncbi:nSTAND1 domain-containing NTPase [Crossiella cryophila]|uniref:WD40 repeat protein/transcriptional regulator with XRE-family HTH domain n=1 Tax=Crossiella cryophila TaxID=43355 RepID=A0A7W7CG24_9PSEU|nr:helix-turn-helix domain-containing protein [Crossiella cryophila]MBB4680267.1 WD40 repeat protein/transcriptional regulator with XRE-family HTH domain [Crossiella cryophila]